MKRIILLLVLVVATGAAYAQKARVYFVRNHTVAGLAGPTKGAINSHMIVDNEKKCTIKNWEYGVFEIDPGDHSITVNFGKGDSPAPYRINLEAGKDYYFMFFPEYFLQLTEKSGERIINGDKIRERNCTDLFKDKDQ